VIKAMQAALITYSAIHILLGLALILMPEPTAALMGFGEINATITYLAALCGVMSIAVSVFWIAVARDPLRNTIGIRFAILWVILAAIVQLYLLIRGVVDFEQAGPGFILDCAFAALFLAFYPYHASSADGPART